MFVQAPVYALPSKIFVHIATVAQEKITFKHSVAKHIVKNGWANWWASRWTARNKCVSIPRSAECKMYEFLMCNKCPSYRTSKKLFIWQRPCYLCLTHNYWTTETTHLNPQTPSVSIRNHLNLPLECFILHWNIEAILNNAFWQKPYLIAMAQDKGSRADTSDCQGHSK